MTHRYSGELIEDDFGTVPVEQDMPFDPERDMINGSQAAQSKREFAGEMRKLKEEEVKQKIERLLSTNVDKQERLREFVAHQMKFFDVSNDDSGDISNFQIKNDGLIFQYNFFSYLKGEDILVTIHLIGPGKYKINGREMLFDEILKLAEVEDRTDKGISDAREKILVFIVESIL